MIYHKTLSEKVIDVIIYGGMIILMLATLYPFWSQAVISLEDGASAYTTGFVLFPHKISLGAYKLAIQYSLLWTGYLNTIIRTVAGVALIIVFTALTAYPLSKKELPFNRAFTGILLFTMLFSGGLIPNYLLIRNLGLINSIGSLVLPGMISAYNVLIMRNFFKSVPDSLEEAARIDGAGYVRIFVSIVLPLSVPVLATIALWVGVGHWNAWFDCLIYINDSKKQVLQVILRKIIIDTTSSDVSAMMLKMNNRTDYTGRQLQSAVIMLSIVPMVAVYPFLQKYFVKGIMIGAIKG